jgi:hypothetical protein
VDLSEPEEQAARETVERARLAREPLRRKIRRFMGRTGVRVWLSKVAGKRI